MFINKSVIVAVSLQKLSQKIIDYIETQKETLFSKSDALLLKNVIPYEYHK